ncbi:MAG: hypothetical protein NZS48_00420 [Gemmata sp.]|nr:hypothetical protein [Gemmata sp.]
MRPDVGTYGQYEFDRLPPLPFEMRGDFAWLAQRPAFDHNIGEERAAEIAFALPKLRDAANRLGIRLPESFTRFMGSPELHQRVRSNTDCYLNLCDELVRSPIGGGWLVRFLADSQGCRFWYLYLTPDGSDHAVVSSRDFYGSETEQWQDEPLDPSETEQWQDEPLDPSEIVYNAESFEAFMCRFWLENEIWYAASEKTPMLDVGREYIERYRRGGA